MTVTFPENLLIDMYGEDTPLQINRDTGIMLERVIKENLSIKEANALLEYYRDACSLYELMSKYRCSAAEILHQRAAARRHLASYLYVTKSGVVGDNNAYPRPLIRALYGEDVPELREDLLTVLNQVMLKALTMEQMRVIRKHYINGMSLSRIAVSEHCTLSKIKFLEQAARQRLRAYLPYFEEGGTDMEMEELL